MAADHLFGQSEFAAHLPHLVLEELPQRLDELERQSLRQPADVVVGLDGDRGAACRREGFDHVRIQRALHQEADVVAHGLGFLLEDIDKAVANQLALRLRIGDAGKIGQERFRGVDRAQVDPEIPAEGLLDLLTLVQPEQAVVHEDARQPIADSTMHQCRGNRGIDSAREAADHPCRVSNQFADPGNLTLDKMFGSPVGRATTDREQEIAEDFATAWRVGNFRVKLHGVEGQRVVLDRSDRRILA